MERDIEFYKSEVKRFYPDAIELNNETDNYYAYLFWIVSGNDDI